MRFVSLSSFASCYLPTWIANHSLNTSILVIRRVPHPCSHPHPKTHRSRHPWTALNCRSWNIIILQPNLAHPAQDVHLRHWTRHSPPSPTTTSQLPVDTCTVTYTSLCPGRSAFFVTIRTGYPKISFFVTAHFFLFPAHSPFSAHPQYVLSLSEHHPYSNSDNTARKLRVVHRPCRFSNPSGMPASSFIQSTNPFRGALSGFPSSYIHRCRHPAPIYFHICPQNPPSRSKASHSFPTSHHLPARRRNTHGTSLTPRL